MRIIKFFGILFLVVLTVLALLPVFLPEKAEKSQSILIKARPQTIFHQVNNLRNWRHWSPFELGDTSRKSAYSGPESGKGATDSWTSKGMRKGSMTILQSNPYSFIQSNLDMGSTGIALDEWSFKETDSVTEVVWTLKLSKLSYPFGKYFGAFIGSLMQPSQEKGLAKLKEVCEALPESVSIEQVILKAQSSVVVVDSTKFAGLALTMAQAFGELNLYMKRSKLEAAGAPFALFYNCDTTTYIKMRIGFPVYDEVKSQGKVEYFVRPGGSVAKATYIGPYNKLGDAHLELKQYFSDFGLHYADEPVCEEYVTGASTEQTSENFQTTIYYFIAE